MFLALKNKYKSIQEKITKKSRFLSPTAFGMGFVLDLFTLNQIDQKLDLIILLSHTGLVTFWIILWHLHTSQRAWLKKQKILKKVTIKIAPTAMQFSFGALFSGFVIFYTKSSSLFASWPFLIILYTLFAGNETFRKFYSSAYFQISVFYFSLFTLLIFLVPLGINDVGVIPFLGSGVISILIIGVFLFFFYKGIQSITKKQYTILWCIVFSLWMGMNALYMQNLIPAIPLSLKSDGIYHQIKRTDTSYQTIKEQVSFWESFIRTENIQKVSGENIYYFSSIFAPKKFKEPVVHEWQRWDDQSNSWKSIYDLTINIQGGRNGGFRGYSYLIDPRYGTWRILVRTPKGQILGQKKLNIIPHSEYRLDVYETL